MAPIELPPFDNLPLDKSGPPGNAWGLWGPNDQLGMLNLLTPETVAAAATEIKEGVRISLNWSLDKPSFPTFERQRFRHEVLHRAPMTMNDDSIEMNTQSSTQWDGFRHYGYQRTKQFYQGHVQDDFSPGSMKLGIHSWVDKGGIIGRGILIDWYAWSKRNNKNLSPFETGAVHLADVMTILAETSVQPRQGDILFIRTGFTAAYNKLSLSEQQAFPDRKPGGLLGLEATRDSLRWIWESGFAAIAGDAPGFERGPATGSYNDPDISVHQWALAGWGLPIGEMFDLEELAQACTSRQRWTFFLTSVPLNIPGGVASPGNAIAIL